MVLDVQGSHGHYVSSAAAAAGDCPLQRSFLPSSPPPRWTTFSIDYLLILPHAPSCSCGAISAVGVQDVEGVVESNPADEHGALRMLALASLPSDEEAARSRQRHAAEELMEPSSRAEKTAMGEEAAAASPATTQQTQDPHRAKIMWLILSFRII
ncbi:MAG: hypothetical protein SGPRY_013283 [Prymnesium sp.]